jgi:FtsH-binding integral membrane protein
MSSNKTIKNSNFDTNNIFNNNAIKGSNTILKIFSCLTIIVLICILIGNYAFKNGILTCDHYVFNTYLYIILSILLVFIVVLVNDQTGFFNSLLISMAQGNIIIMMLLILITFFGLTYALSTIDPNNILASNFVWLLLILILGIFIIPIIWFGRLTNVVGLSGMITVLITLIVGIAGYYYGDKIVTFDWDKYLNYALIALIIVSLIGIFFIKDGNTFSLFFLLISIISLAIFVLLLLSNHKKLKENSDKCIDGKVVPNYPYESFGIFIKMLNVFKDLIRILGYSKLRRR